MYYNHSKKVSSGDNQQETDRWLKKIRSDIGYYIWNNAFIPYDPNYPDREYKIKLSCFVDYGYGSEEISSLSTGKISVKSPFISNVTPAIDCRVNLFDDPNDLQRIEIIWNSNIYGSPVYIELIDENGMPYIYITEVPGEMGYYLWENPLIPYDPLNPGRKYKIRVKSTIDTFYGIQEIYSISIGGIYAKQPSINSVTPVNTDYIFAGNSYHITWSDNFTDSVKIELFNNEVFNNLDQEFE